MSIRQMSLLFRRVGSSLKAGVDVLRIWSGEAQRSSPADRPYLQRIFDRITAGDTLTEAMVACDGHFPKFVCEMVDVGERTGRLDEVFTKLAEHYDHVRDLRKTFLTGIAWPAVQLFGAIMVIALLIWILGMIPPGIDGKPIDVLGLGLTGNAGVIRYFIYIGLFAGAIALVVQSLRKGWFGSSPLRVAASLPGLGHCIHTMALERLTWSLAMALEAGMDAKRSIKMALRSTNNPLYLEHIDSVEQSIVRGTEFHEALGATGVFPAEFLGNLQAAELSGNEVNSLLHLSRDYEQRARMLAGTITVIGTGLVWGTVVIIIVALIFRLASFYIGTLNSFL